MIGERHILIVDDDSNLRRVIQVLLEHEGYAASTAASGVEALQILRDTAQGVVITDVRMPGMSGIDLLRQIREKYPPIVVLIMTAHGSREGAAEAMGLGAYDYLTKPVRADVLRRAVRGAFAHLSAREESAYLHTLSKK